MELNVSIVMTHINISMEKTHLHKHCYSEWMYTCTYLTCVYFGEYLCRTSYVFKANLSSRNIHKMINIVNQSFILCLILCLILVNFTQSLYKYLQRISYSPQSGVFCPP